MKTLNECIAEGFEPTRKYGWFDYKRDYVRKIWKLAEKMGFEKNFGYNRWCYYYNIELPEISNMPWAKHTRGYYFMFLDRAGQCLPEMRMFISNSLALSMGLFTTYPATEFNFKYVTVPEKVILDMFTRVDHPDKFLMYLENWNTNHILEVL